jgi:hypothetical protein
LLPETSNSFSHGHDINPLNIETEFWRKNIRFDLTSFSSQFLWVGKSGVALSLRETPTFTPSGGKGRQFLVSGENKFTSLLKSKQNSVSDFVL